ncbi:MBL fold metallo-hydrolase [Anoxybacteroides tepidamans]|uniref:MBL fold metallo-hydrolase n=1 Tax=Anoxybacteroides tepidamans TaxID=265948 RepID=UPI000482C4BB|nr:MBL fold metallo-hydrolase [Anoxybacillus tepidamans]
MELINISDRCYYFKGAVNIGYVHHGDIGILIDAGLDRSATKKVLNILEEQRLPLTHLFITHAHADHYGGAAYLQKQRNVYTVAPMLEEAILRNPVLEPIYLFQGNWPLAEMRNKFLEGEAMRVDEVMKEGTWDVEGLKIESIALPGHSYYQLGYIIDGVLYAGDAFFGIEALEKHKIPYIVDADETLRTLQRLLSLPTSRAVPGHGTYAENAQSVIQENIAWHERVLASMEQIISNHADGLSQEQLIHEMCVRWEIETNLVSSWMLYRTAITGYLSKLIKDGKALLSIERHSLWIRANQGI